MPDGCECKEWRNCRCDNLMLSNMLSSTADRPGCSKPANGHQCMHPFPNYSRSLNYKHAHKLACSQQDTTPCQILTETREVPTLTRQNVLKECARLHRSSASPQTLLVHAGHLRLWRQGTGPHCWSCLRGK